MRDQFSRRDILEILNLSPMMFRVYLDEGLVIPDIVAGEGRGKRRKFSFKNLCEFAVLTELYKCHYPLSTVSWIFELLRYKTWEKGGMVGNVFDFYTDVKRGRFIAKINLYRDPLRDSKAKEIREVEAIKFSIKDYTEEDVVMGVGEIDNTKSLLLLNISRIFNRVKC